MNKLFSFEVKRKLNSHKLLLFFIITTAINILLILGSVISSYLVVWPIITWVIFGIISIVSIFIIDLKSFFEDLFSDTRYFTESLPYNWKGRLTAKFASSIVIFLGYSLLFWFFAIADTGLLASYANKQAHLDLTLNIASLAQSVAIFIIVGLFFYLLALMICYFPVVLRKSLRYNKNRGTLLTFIFFLFTVGGIGFINDILDAVFQKVSSLKLPCVANINFDDQSFSASMGYLSVNIMHLLFCIGVFAGLFFLSSYLLDKEVDI